MRPSITQAGEPVQGIPPELDRTSEAVLSDALSSATRSLLDRGPTAAERRQFVDMFWQAELTWTLAQEQGISAPRPEVQIEALRYAEGLAAEAG